MGAEEQSWDDELDEGQPDPALEAQLPPGARKHLRQVEKDLKAERDARAADREKLLRYERRETLERVLTETGLTGVTVEDLGDVDPEAITATLVRVKADEKSQAVAAQKSEQAKAAGYESVEDYERDLAAARAVRERNTVAQQRQTQVASVGGPPPVDPEKTDTEVAYQTFKDATSKGMPEDKGMAEFMRTKRELAAEAAEAKA